MSTLFLIIYKIAKGKFKICAFYSNFTFNYQRNTLLKYFYASKTVTIYFTSIMVDSSLFFIYTQ